MAIDEAMTARQAEQPTSEPPRWRALLRELAVRPSRSKGQNFLTDRAIVGRIADAAQLQPGDTVIEIGPGLGILTAELIARVGPTGRVIAVELDRRLAAFVREEFAALPTLRLIEGNVLRLSPHELLAELPEAAPYAVVANLPYNITSAVLRHFLDHPRRPTALTVLVQREVAERIVARPPEMSVLAVAVQFYGTPSIALRLAAGAFIPRPKVDSAAIRIALHPTPSLPDAAIPAFFAVVAAGFGQKRKQLVNSLGAGLALPRQAIEAATIAAGVAAERRAETLDVAEWLRLHAAFAAASERRDGMSAQDNTAGGVA